MDNASSLILSTRVVGLRVACILVGTTFAITLTSCKGITIETPIATPEVSTSEPEPHRPEPQEPHIMVAFSGLDENSLATIHFRTLSGNEPLTGTHPGNGQMRVVLPEHQGISYVVTAEADGYVSDPISYTIQISDNLIYLVVNYQIPFREVSNLEFQFKPITTPTGD